MFLETLNKSSRAGVLELQLAKLLFCVIRLTRYDDDDVWMR